MSKGSRRRPMAISQDEWTKNWERIFSNKNKQKEEKENADKKAKKDKKD